jgi:hypothetical protein
VVFRFSLFPDLLAFAEKTTKIDCDARLESKERQLYIRGTKKVAEPAKTLPDPNRLVPPLRFTASLCSYL